MVDRQVEADLSLDGGVVLRARRVVGREALSELFSYVVDAPCTDRTKPAALVGTRASLCIRDALGGERTIHGLVGACSVEVTDEGFGVWVVELVPRAHIASLGRDARILRDIDPVSAAALVLERAGVPSRIAVGERPAVRARIAQYGESDWDFAIRLLDEEGMHTYFDHEAESILVIADGSAASPPIPGGAVLPARAALGLSSTAAAIDQIGPALARRADRVAHRGFDPAKPDLALAASAGEGAIERYDAPGAGLTHPDALARRSAREQSGHAALGSAVKARATTARVTPGHRIEVQETALFVTAVAIDVIIEHRDGAEGRRALSVELEALPVAAGYVPAPRRAAPVHVGLEVARVAGVPGEEIDVDGAARVRIHTLWDREPVAPGDPGRWSRVVQRGTESSMLMPRVGWNVLTVSEEGSVDAPTVVSRLFDATHPPPYSLPAEKTSLVLRTATSPGGGSFNEIRMEDPKGSEKLIAIASRDMEIDVGRKRVDVTKGSAKLEVGRDQIAKVGEKLEVRVLGDATTTIGKDQKETVGIDRALNVAGDRTTKVGAGRKLGVKQNAERTVGSRALTVGAALLDITLGAVKAQSRMVHVLVGGAVIKATPRTMSEKVGSEVTASSFIGKLPAAAQKIAGLPGIKQAIAKLPSKKIGMSIQTIGATKLESGFTRSIDVTGPYSETAGLALAYDTGSFFDKTTGAATWSVGSLQITADEQKISIQSDEKVELVCGDSRLVVLPDEVRLESKTLDIGLQGTNAIDIKAAEIHHN